MQGLPVIGLLEVSSPHFVHPHTSASSNVTLVYVPLCAYLR